MLRGFKILPKFGAWLLVLLSAYVCSAASKIEIIKNNKTEWNIVAITPSQEVQFASLELQKYFLKMGGASLPVNDNLGNSLNLIVCLRENFPVKYKMLAPSKAEGYNGYAVLISEKPEVIIITGEDGPGLIYGVYDFLEKLGCRWFYPQQDWSDTEVVPQKSTIAVEAGSWKMASPIKNRIYNGDAWFFNMDYPAAEKQLDWAMKNRYNSIGWQASGKNTNRSLLMQYKDLEDAGLITELTRRGMFLHGPGHSFDQFLPSDKYFDKHPEWFGLLNGKRVPHVFLGAQFCWSNPQAREQFIENALAFIEQTPAIEIFSIWPFDGGTACGCDVCKKEGSSNSVMSLMNGLINKVKRVRPEVEIETIGGYGPVSEPPSDLQAINPDLRIIWAHWGRNHSIGYDDSGYNKTNLEGWRKAGKGGFTLCQYYTDNFAEPWVMGPFTRAMKSDRAYFLKNNIDGFYALTYSPGFWWNHGLNGHIAGQSFYDVSIDPFSLIRDYGIFYYGPEAGPLLSAYYEEWAKHIELSYRVRNDSKKEDREMLAEQRRKWINPATKNEKNKLYSYRLAKVEKLHKLAESLTEMHRLHHVVMELRSENKFDEAGIVLEKARVQTDSVMLMFYTLAGLNQGLIDKNEVPGFIRISVKDWVEKEAGLIASRYNKITEASKKLNETEMLPSDVY